MTSMEKDVTSMLTVRRTTIAAVVVVTLCSGTVGAYVASADSSAGPKDGSRSGVAPKVMPERLAAGYEVFRRDVGPGDSLARYLSPDGDLVAKIGVNPALARRIPTAADVSTKVWLVPSAHGACLLRMGPDAIGPGGSCGTTMTDDPYGTADSSQNLDGSIDVIGVVRDGVKSVSLVLEDGTERQIAVADNVYVAQGRRIPKAIHLVDPQRGPVSVKIAGF